MRKILSRFLLCALSILGAANVSCAQETKAAVDVKVFRLDTLLKLRGFVPEKAPGKTFGSLDADRNSTMPISNQRWFLGRNRIEASVLVFPDEAAVRRFDTFYINGHQLPPISPFSVPIVDGVRDNWRQFPGKSDWAYNIIAVGRVYIAMQIVRETALKTKISAEEFTLLVKSAKQQLIARAKAIPNS